MPTAVRAPHIDEAARRASEVARRHPAVRRLILFGSRARGDFDAHSDHDLYAQFDYDALGWIEYTELIRDLEAALETDVDLVSGSDVASRSPVLWSQIQEEGVLLYDRQEDR